MLRWAGWYFDVKVTRDFILFTSHDGFLIYAQNIFFYLLNNNNNNNDNISYEKTRTWLRKGNLKRKTESLLIAAQNNAIRTNHIKAKIDKRQQNSKCRLCSDRDENIYHIISKCSKLATKEYKTRQDWVGTVIYWVMYEKSKFDHTNKWYMHNPGSVLENYTHKLLWDFEIHTNHLISTRRSNNNQQ